MLALVAGLAIALLLSTTGHARAYSDMVDHASKTMADFADDNTTGNQGCDHLGNLPADASTDDVDGKAPVTTRNGKRP